MPWKVCKPMDERLKFIARLLDGDQMASLCRDFGISRKTGYKIWRRYNDCGLEALTDRSRRPYRQANQLPFQIEKLIVRLKQDKATGVYSMEVDMLKMTKISLGALAGLVLLSGCAYDRYGYYDGYGGRYGYNDGYYGRYGYNDAYWGRYGYSGYNRYGYNYLGRYGRVDHTYTVNGVVYNCLSQYNATYCS